MMGSSEVDSYSQLLPEAQGTPAVDTCLHTWNSCGEENLGVRSWGYNSHVWQLGRQLRQRELWPESSTFRNCPQGFPASGYRTCPSCPFLALNMHICESLKLNNTRNSIARGFLLCLSNTRTIFVITTNKQKMEVF